MTTLHRQQLAALASSILLAACGGGGGDNSSPAQPAASLKLTGVAATGRAIANAPVQVKCSSGSGTATTQANGAYAIEIAGGSLPCVLAVTPAGGGALHSAIDGSGAGDVTVNITPLTELVVARAASGAPADLFATFAAAAQAKIGTAALDAAVISVAAALQGAVDLSGVNPIKDTLVAANGSTPGNGLDQLLDTLQARLAAANLTLTELSTAVTSGGSALAPLQNALRCPALTSGRYVSLSMAGNEDGPLFYEFDAATLTATLDGEDITLTDLGDCRYSVVNDNSHESLVSKSGIKVTASTRTDPSSPFFGKTDLSLDVPLQTIPLADLVGEWNALEYFRDPVNGQTTFAPLRATWTIDAAGNVTFCGADDAPGDCSASNPDEAMRPNPAGGFDIGDEDPIEGPSRVFAFRSAGGQLSMFLMYSTGRGLVVLTKPAPLALPAVGTVARYRDFNYSVDGYLTAPQADVATTVTAVDAAAGSYQRRRASDGRIDRFTINSPLPGLRTRAANDCTLDSASVSCAAIVTMPLPGLGIGVYASSGPQNFFGVTVERP